MAPEAIRLLQTELDGLRLEVSDGIVNPVSARRINEINSLLATGGEYKDMTYTFCRKKYNRVTSFTKDRR